MIKRVKTKVTDKPTDEKTPADQDEETSNQAKRLEDLPGIGPVTAARLRDLGYSFVGLATARADAVAAEMGPSVSFMKAKAWIMTAQEAILAVIQPKTGKEVAKFRKAKRTFYKTGSKDFNTLMGGGFGTMRTTGLAGRFSTGKTQAIFDGIIDCLSRTKYSFCIWCNTPFDKEYETCPDCGREMFRKAAYVETEPDTFSDVRLEEIAHARGLSIDLDNLWVFEAEKIPTAKAQYLQYKIIQKMLQAKEENIGFVGVDSFTAKFRPGYSRTEMLPVRTREFTEHFLLMDYLAAKYNIAWVLSCQVIGGVRPGAVKAIIMKTGDKSGYYPVGGDYLLHSMTTWVSLQQVKTELYEAVIFDSSYLPRGKCEFMLTKRGLMDGIK